MAPDRILPSSTIAEKKIPTSFSERPKGPRGEKFPGRDISGQVRKEINTNHLCPAVLSQSRWRKKTLSTLQIITLITFLWLMKHIESRPPFGFF